MAPPFTLSKDNIELQFATNHLGMLSYALFLFQISALSVILIAFAVLFSMIL